MVTEGLLHTAYKLPVIDKPLDKPITWWIRILNSQILVPGHDVQLDSSKDIGGLESSQGRKGPNHFLLLFQGGFPPRAMARSLIRTAYLVCLWGPLNFSLFQVRRFHSKIPILQKSDDCTLVNLDGGK
jgi:hypothetical protein